MHGDDDDDDDDDDDAASSTTVVDELAGPRPETRSPVTYVSAPSVNAIPPMLAMMDMSLGRLEPPTKEGTILPGLAVSRSVFSLHMLWKTFGNSCRRIFAG